MTTAPESILAATRGEATANERTKLLQPRWRFVYTWTPALVKSARILADGGTLRLAADLVEDMIADDRVAGVLGARVRGLLGLPLSFEDGSGRARRKRAVKRAIEAQEDFWTIFPEAELTTVAAWGIVLGVGLGEFVWERDESTGREVQRLYAWHPRWLRFDYSTRRWMLRVGDGIEEIEVRPGDRKWLLFTPYGFERPWSWAAWRGIAPWWLLKTFGRNDWGQHSEVHGDPIRLGTSPAGSQKADREAYAADLNGMGSHSVLVPPSGYGLELVEATAQTWKMFPAELSEANTAISILLAGANLTSEVKGGSRAAATVHDDIRHDLIAWDAAALSTVMHEQALVPWAEVNFNDAKLAPWPKWDTAPPDSEASRAAAQKDRATAFGLLADAIQKLRAQGVNVDLAELLELFEVPVDENAPTVEAAPATPPSDSAPPPAESAPPPATDKPAPPAARTRKRSRS